MCNDDASSDNDMTKLDLAIAFCGLFEAELLVELMLRYWNHPRASDRDFRNYLLEATAGILNRSREGEQFVEELPAEDMNFVAALWYAETCQLTEVKEADTEARQFWLTSVRRALPSCFCSPDDLT
jgi:hypothetical protein